jgi:hypothetical protein
MKGNAMNIDYAYEMYRRLLAATLTHRDFTSEISFRLKQIAEKNHCGNGYFSFDGIADDVTEMFGDEDLAWQIVNNA